MDSSRLAATLYAALPACLARPAPAGNHLVTNPGFEELDEQTAFAAAWEPTYWSNPHGKATLSEGVRGGGEARHKS